MPIAQRGRHLELGGGSIGFGIWRGMPVARLQPLLRCNNPCLGEKLGTSEKKLPDPSLFCAAQHQLVFPVQ
jgi:hypothetical protein